MTPADYRLIAAAIVGIALSIILIIRGRLHPFVGLLCGAFTVGLLAGLPMEETAKAVEKGAGAILGLDAHLPAVGADGPGQRFSLGGVPVDEEESASRCLHNPHPLKPRTEGLAPLSSH